MQTFTSLTRLVGAISAQYLSDKLYVFLENHSNSCAVKSCCAGLLGLFLDALACVYACECQQMDFRESTLLTSFEDFAELIHNAEVNCTVLEKF
jgi:hypothetical protein